MQAAKLQSEENISVSTLAGKIALLVATDIDSYAMEKEGSNLGWQSSEGEGHYDETVRMTKIDATNVDLTAGNGLFVQHLGEKGEDYSDRDVLEATIDQLASEDDSYSYLKTLKDRDDVGWEAIVEAHEQWDYDQEGMTAIAAAVVIIVVTILTAGAAAAAAQGATAAATGSTVITGTAAATTTTAAVVPTATAFGLGSMAGAAVSATATTTALSLVNNKGNLGDIFSDLTSAETLKGIATNTLTAGVLGGLSVSTDLSNTPSLTNPFPEIERLDQVIAHSVVSSGIDTAINGGSFGDKLTDRLKYAAVDAMADNLAGDIGDNYHNSDKTLLDEIIHKGSHAALGCAMAEANEMDCGSGATGGVIGEVAAQWYTNANAFEGETDLEWEAYQERGIQVANMASTIGAGLLGKDIDAAQMAGVNAAENNWLSIPLIVLGFGLLTASEQANAPTDENDVESGAALEWASGFVPVSAGASVVAKANPSWWQKVTSKLGLGGVGKGVTKPTVTDPKLNNLVKDLYKGANAKKPIGTGSTADAIRREAATGQPVGGKFHADKGQQYVNALNKWIRKNPNASASDRSAAQSMLDDLNNALGVGK